jgi:S1-C subfamily serine protease
MLKTIKSALTSITLAVAIVYGAVIAPELHNQYLRYEVGDSVVKVMHLDRDSGGTGFAIEGASGTNYIMTNRHVCGVSVGGFVRLKIKNREYFRRVIHRDRVHDLCLIEGIESLSPISIGSNQAIGSILYVVGHPGLRKLTTSAGEYIGRESIELPFDVKTREQCPGTVIELNIFQQLFSGRDFICLKSYEALATSAVIYGGNSGSPVVNRWGNLIGVAFAGNTSQERDNYIVPLYYVKSLLKKF